AAKAAAPGASAAEASTYTGTPSAEIVQVVIDFSKAVDISLSEMKAGIHTNRNGSVGNLLGFIDNGSSGFLMSSDPEMNITAKGDSFDAGNGTVKWVDDTKITYTPSGIISHIDYIYAVYALNGSTAGTRIMVEIQIIPADMVYYEAEALVDTDLELIDTDNVSDQAPGWSRKEEGNSADTRQDSDPGIDRITNMTIDRKNIPGGAFFVDSICI
ncbi:MAG: hypothetical protein IKM59_04865, partial [Oscillospiraceae bacterium]|nr:hypothetical protein [Oscillospiraceae bacterium]